MSRATRQIQHAVAGAVALATATLLSPSVARAEFPLPLPHEIHQEVRAHVHDVLRTIGRIPVQIAYGQSRDFEIFLGGSSYYGPHRHNHVIYNFPVYIDNNVYYRPYTYCNDRLYGSYSFGSYDYRPQFWVGWGLESQGRWCNHHHSYYPTAHSCFRSNSYRSDRRWSQSTPNYYRNSRSYSQNDRHDRYDRNDRYDNRGSWRENNRAPSRQWSQPQYQGQRRSTDGREWRDRQGQPSRRPEVRGNGSYERQWSQGAQRNPSSQRNQWSQPNRSQRPQVKSATGSRHDSKGNSKHDAKRDSKHHQGSRDHN